MSNFPLIPTTPTTLTLYTSISETEYEQLQTTGILTCDEFYNKVDKYGLEIYNVFSAENDINPKALELRKEIIESWDWIFDINNTNDYMVYKNKTIQAVFWELRKEDVLCCKKYKNKGRV